MLKTRNNRMKPLATYGVLTLLLLIAAAPEGQENPADGGEAKLQDELRATLKALREERSAYYSRQRARTEAIEAARAPVKRLEIELSELRSRQQEADKTLADLKADVEKFRKEEAADGLRAGLPAELEKSLKDAKEFIDKGIPYRAADRGLRLGKPGEGTPTEQFGRYWSFLQEEFRVARSGEAYSAEVPLDGGRAKPARIFRVGHLILGYVTEDGLQVGLWNGSAWVAPSTPEQEQRIREAVETLDRRRTPSLLNLPVLRKVGR